MNYDNKILCGKKLAAQILDKIKEQITNLSNKRKPSLAVILIGDDPASHIYVKNKKNACAKVGIESHEFSLPKTTSEQELITLISNLNNNADIDGILVQLPLPSHLNSSLVINTIFPDKDVDGFHRYNIGSLALNDPKLCPCTPHGVMYMLDSINLDYHGKNAVVIGTSNIVGRPMALELINRGATVTICNSKTINLPTITSKADIVIAAAGRPKLVKQDWVRENSIIIDVGINRLENGKLCGDVDFENVIDKVAYITPVPSGVGPMTIAMLMENTMRCHTMHI